MIGDSLLGQTDTELADVLERHGMDVTVTDTHVNGSGLIGRLPYTDPTTLEVTWYPTALAWVSTSSRCTPTSTPSSSSTAARAASATSGRLVGRLRQRRLLRRLGRQR